MKLIGITMRVDIHPDYGERRDALDQNWLRFFEACGLTPVYLPNSLAVVQSYLDHLDFCGLLLSGGNSPKKYLGDAPERDDVDAYLIDWAIEHNVPLLGVCRGMQSIQVAFEQDLVPIEGHVMPEMEILINEQPAIINSYHRLGTDKCAHPLTSWAKSKDGIIKAVKHEHAEVYGIMWHPERNTPFQQQDIVLFKQVYRL